MGLKSHAEKLRRQVVWLIAAPLAVEALFAGIYLFTSDLQMLFAGCTAGGATFCLLSLALAKRLSNEITVLQSAIAEAEREVAELQQRNLKLISAMRHEMNEGFTAVGVSLATIADGQLGKLPTDVAKEIQNAERNITRLSLSTKNLLAWQRIEAKRSFLCSLEEMPVENLLEEATHAAKYLTAQRAIQVKRSFPASPAAAESAAPNKLVKVLGDRNTLIQVIFTLLANTIQRCKSGDTIEISARDLKDVVEIQIAAPNAPLLNPQDGITERLFDWPAATGSGIGTGKARSDAAQLGLALCKVAIEAHGGRIGATSKKGDGIAFWFRLPASAAPASATPTDDSLAIG